MESQERRGNGYEQSTSCRPNDCASDSFLSDICTLHHHPWSLPGKSSFSASFTIGQQEHPKTDFLAPPPEQEATENTECWWRRRNANALQACLRRRDNTPLFKPTAPSPGKHYKGRSLYVWAQVNHERKTHSSDPNCPAPYFVQPSIGGSFEVIRHNQTCGIIRRKNIQIGPGIDPVLFMSFVAIADEISRKQQIQTAVAVGSVLF